MGQHNGGATEVQKESEANAPDFLKQCQKFLDSHSRIADEGAKRAYR